LVISPSIHALSSPASPSVLGTHHGKAHRQRQKAAFFSSPQRNHHSAESFPSLCRLPRARRTPRPSEVGRAIGPSCQDARRQRRDGPCAHCRLALGSRPAAARCGSTRSAAARPLGSLAGEAVRVRRTLAGCYGSFSPSRFFGCFDSLGSIRTKFT
jgi:hypothetical protein